MDILEKQLEQLNRKIENKRDMLHEIEEQILTLESIHKQLTIELTSEYNDLDSLINITTKKAVDKSLQMTYGADYAIYQIDICHPTHYIPTKFAVLSQPDLKRVQQQIYKHIKRYAKHSGNSIREYSVGIQRVSLDSLVIIDAEELLNSNFFS